MDGWWPASYYVVGIAVGEATITAEYGPFSSSATVTVSPAVLEVRPAEAAISVGEKVNLGASAMDEHGAEIPAETLQEWGAAVAIQWVSDDEFVASVDQDGVVTGVARGRATIHAGVSGPLGPHFGTAARAVVSVDSAKP